MPSSPSLLAGTKTATLERPSTLEIRVQAKAGGGLATDFADPGFGRLFSDHMLVADFSDGQWQDALIQPFASLSLAPSTSVLHYGQSVFEGMRAQTDRAGDVRLFRPSDHFVRMNRSADRMCMPAIPTELFLDGIRQLIHIDESWVPSKPDCALYVRPVYFSTDETLGVRISEKYRFAVISSPVQSYHKGPLGLWLSRDNVRSHMGGTGDIKTAGNYGASLHATHGAKERGFDEVIWVDGRDRSRVEECGTMNLFFVIQGTVVTPSLTGTILPGITRDTVLSILRGWSVPFEERRVTVSELLDRHMSGQLEECFGTGTAAGIVSVDRIGYEDGCTLRLEGTGESSFSARLAVALSDARLSSERWTEKIC